MKDAVDVGIQPVVAVESASLGAVARDGGARHRVEVGVDPTELVAVPQRGMAGHVMWPRGGGPQEAPKPISGGRSRDVAHRAKEVVNDLRESAFRPSSGPRSGPGHDCGRGCRCGGMARNFHRRPRDEGQVCEIASRIRRRLGFFANLMRISWNCHMRKIRFQR